MGGHGSGAAQLGAQASSSSSSSKKRRHDTEDESCPPTNPQKKTRIKAETSEPSEKRLRRYQLRPGHRPIQLTLSLPRLPQFSDDWMELVVVSFADIYDRATSQRFYVLSGTPRGTAECPEETVELTGSTGNIYTVEIARQPTCDCPHSLKGNQCKHVVYVLARVLRAKFEYTYQLALLSTELQGIFAHAPPVAAEDDSKSNNRKPVDGDCPICFSEMEPEEGGGEAVVWCRAACGQNGAGTQATCPYCRSVWESDKDIVKTINKIQGQNSEGYVNVADQVGVSPRRDFSSYSRWWPGSRYN
ncbi:SWIM zinc finger protein [Podospora appendiculata]|uniref:SWIM zinc finger protein n=1 Tax=Podospora appendiculata TaxID=314037 RepID=A0AAE1CH87_9PEZI|nr:SWIM zinc finger protein [Podospora appendiculata]